MDDEFFRRSLGVLLIAVGAFAGGGCSDRREAAMAPPITTTVSDASLTWGRAVQVPGTNVMRVELVGEESGFSSRYGETRNILFLDPGEKAGRWLLPDSRHVLAETLELHAPSDESNAGRTLATVTLVKQVEANPPPATGRLLLFDPVGKVVRVLADDARRLHVASVGPSGEFLVLYERGRQFVIAQINAATFALERDQAFEVPALK